jgi:hypothetical protein
MKTWNAVVLAALFALAGARTPEPARAESSAKAEVVKVVGYLVKIDKAPDGKSALATLLVKGKKIVVFISDSLTLTKFKIGKIRKDDEIRCKYEPGAGKDGSNLSVYFRRTAGC